MSQPTWYEQDMIRNMMGLFGGRALRGITSAFNSPNILMGKAGIMGMANTFKSMLEKDERRALIICDDFTQKFCINVTEILNFVEIEYRIFSGIEPEVPLANVQEGAKVCEEFKPVVIIAIGGGSVMDAAKSIMLMYEKPDSNLHMLLPIGDPLGLRKKVKYLAAIPTTSGTGSEVTGASVLTDMARTPPKKLIVTNAELVPDIAVLDTIFVEDMPPTLTVGSGLDAFAHSVGSYVSNWGSPLIDALNITAISEVMKYLPRAYKYGKKDFEARAHMQIAAAIAGLGFGNSQPGIDHAMGHSLGKVFNVHHGLSVGLVLPYSLGFQAKVTDRWKGLCPTFNIETKNKTDDVLFKEFINAIKTFYYSVDAPTCVKELKHPTIDEKEYKEKIDLVAEYAHLDAVTLTSFRPVNIDLYKKIYEYAWDGKNIDF